MRMSLPQGEDPELNRSIPKRVGLLGGSFDPVHHGHRFIVDSFLKSQLFHEIWILPAPDPPHKQQKQLTSFHHRVKMLELAFRQLQEIYINEIEKELPSPSYTLQTVTELQLKHPDCHFFFCLGGDSLRDFTNWYRYEEILDRVVLVVAERKGVDLNGLPDEILHRTIQVDHEPIETSSTSIRQIAGGDTHRLSQRDLHKKVIDYIQQHHLYREE